MGELIAYMVGVNGPNELKAEAENQMQAVEEVNQDGATAYLVIAETKAEAKQVEKEYALSNCAPEYSRIINTLDGAQVGRTLTYSVNSYIYDAQGKATGDLLALVKAIYNYGASALAYNQAN